MTNSNREKFTRAELADIYEKIILFYEVTNGLQGYSLSSRMKGYRKLIGEKKIEVRRFEREQDLSAEEHPEFDFTSNFIWFHDAKKNSLKSMLYLLRNAAAHADIRRCKSNQYWYHIEHHYKNKVKLICSMKKTDFWAFVEEVKKSIK